MVEFGIGTKVFGYWLDGEPAVTGSGLSFVFRIALVFGILFWEKCLELDFVMDWMDGSLLESDRAMDCTDGSDRHRNWMVLWVWTLAREQVVVFLMD